MSNLRQAAQQALEALEDIFGKNKVDVGAINTLRAALAEPNKCTHGVTDNCKECYIADEQEPVFDCPRCGHCCPQTEQEPVAREHITDGNPCWCEPEINYKDPETGISVIVHKEPQ